MQHNTIFFFKNAKLNHELVLIEIRDYYNITFVQVYNFKNFAVSSIKLRLYKK